MGLNNCFPPALIVGMVLACFSLEAAQAASPMAEHQVSPFSSAYMIRVGDRLNLPLSPHTPGTAQIQTPVSPTQAGANVAAGVEAKFAQAAGSANNLLTRQAALASGWGWAADHFSEIDRQNKGKVSLNDVLDYINQRSSLALPRARTDGT